MFNKRFYKYQFLKILREKGTPQYLAFSACVGVFIGLFIPLSIQMLVAFFVAYIFRLNKFITVSSVWVTNPLTIIPIYSFYFYLGSLITGISVLEPLNILKKGDLNLNSFIAFGKIGLSLFFLGAFITAVIGSILTYFVVLSIVKKYKKYKKYKKNKKSNDFL